MTDKPNIVFIMSDQHTPSVAGCYGNSAVFTPNLDRLAGNGVVFDNAYCNNPVCVPSRMSMMTGLHSHNIDVWCNADPLLPHLATWPLLLRLGGYETIISGRNHLVWGDRLGGFSRRLCGDDNHKIPFIQPDATMMGGRAPQGLDASLGSSDKTSHALHDIEANKCAIDYLQKRHDDPFALFVGYYQPHAPLTCLDDYYEKYSDFNPDLYLEEIVDPIYENLIKRLQLDREIEPRKLVAAHRAYYGMISHVDTLVGELLEELEKNDLMRNTIVIYTSDHGEMLGRHQLWHKMNFYEDSVKVPLIISNPERFGMGRRITENVSLLDIFPTFMDLASIDEEINLDGCSLVPFLENTMTNWNNKVIAESIGVVRGEPGIMLKRDQFKLLLYHDNNPILFDLEKDPLEHYDLSGSKEHAAVLKSMIAEASVNWNPNAINKVIDNHLKHIYFHKKVEGR